MSKSQSKTSSGRIPQKRGDTLVGTIEKKYGVDLGHRSDKRLATVLKETGVPSLSKLLKIVSPPRKR